MEGRDLTFVHGGRPQVALPGNPMKIWGALLVLLALTNIFTLFGFAKARKASKEAELALQDQSVVAE